MTEVYLALGSNLGNREENLLMACRKIAAIAGEIISLSPVYETEPVGFSAETDFLNLVLKAETVLDPVILLAVLMDIEKAMGRTRGTERNMSRSIDIDILFYGEKVINTEQLEIPHPRLHARMFVLKPLFDLAPGLKHPVLNTTVSRLLETCPDYSAVRLFREPFDLGF